LTNININKKQISILAVVTAMAVVMTVSPVGMIFSNNIAFAGGKDHDNDDDDDDDDDDGNSASQIIAQVQRSIQNSQVVSGGDTENSGNNFNFQNQENSGNNALAQSNDDDGDDDGNSASQAIVQSQSSRQNSQVVSGGDTEDSGNNFNFQNQENSGNNALAQQ
jgi:hypothetical protein